MSMGTAASSHGFHDWHQREFVHVSIRFLMVKELQKYWFVKKKGRQNFYELILS